MVKYRFETFGGSFECLCKLQAISPLHDLKQGIIAKHDGDVAEAKGQLPRDHHAIVGLDPTQLNCFAVHVGVVLRK